MKLTLKNTPQAVLVLGLYCGSGPCVLIPILMVVYQSYAAQLTYALVSYLSILLTFIGAVRWGYILSRSEMKESKMTANFFNLGLAVAPSVIGWASLLLGSSGWYLLLGAYALILVQDISSDLYAPYYKSKNVILEGLAIVSLLLCNYLG